MHLVLRWPTGKMNRYTFQRQELDRLLVGWQPSYLVDPTPLRRKISLKDKIGRGTMSDKLDPSEDNKSLEDLTSKSSQIRSAILERVHKLGPTKSCCPSEIPRLLYPKASWRQYMPLTREVAVQLHSDGRLDICQKGRRVQDVGELKGPIRLRLVTQKSDKKCKD